MMFVYLLSFRYFVIIALLVYSLICQMPHLSARFFTRSLDTLVFGFMVSMLPLSPLTCALLSGRTQYLRQYRRTLVKSAHLAKALHRSRVVSRNLERKLQLGAKSFEAIEGSCTHCGQCCVDRSCVFLSWDDDSASRCSIYGNWFWRLTSCGGYPLDSESIDVYSCPSFKAIPIKIIRSDSSASQ
jgi:hypothetical protein